ncbi:MAG: toxin-antitoxin system YwqK family antitoxin [Bacteroidetes bacterium]|nr:MAG: toxin-antitoxin system YwqK family antitoxin [Bacteroidota bacterium]
MYVTGKRSQIKIHRAMIRFLLFLLVFILGGCHKIKPIQNLETIENRDEAGRLVEKYTCLKGTTIKQGLYQAFSPEGKVIEEAHYEKDSLHGTRKLFYKNGRPEVIEQYVMNQFEGPYQSFYSNGRLKIEGRYYKNEMSGDWKKYYETGELMEVVTFEHNEENGPFREYYKNGQLKTEGNYLNGDREHGLLKKYNENGQLIAKMQCLYGVCQTVWTLEAGDLEFDEAAFRAKVERIKNLENE